MSMTDWTATIDIIPGYRSAVDFSWTPPKINWASPSAGAVSLDEARAFARELLIACDKAEKNDQEMRK